VEKGRNPRADFLEIYHAAVEAVSGKTVVSKALAVGKYPDTFHVVAIGKAADAMVQGVPENKIKSALLISKHGHISQQSINNPLINCIESDHPIPKQASLKAGQALIEYLQKLPVEEPCLFLISGGTSALVEVLNDGWNLQKLQELTDYLLANAYSIDEINAVRRNSSKIKGGGLWNYVGQRPVFCLMISDVPNDDSRIIGSGLLFYSEDDVKLPKLPLKYAKYINSVKKEHENTGLEDFIWKIVATLSDAKKAAKIKAQQLGYTVNLVDKFLDGNAEEVATMCVQTIQKKSDILFIWGGETTVILPENAGKGGRNQHLALSAAIEMQGLENVCLLAAGTDGSDGMTTATGAVVDNQTVVKGVSKGLDAVDYLKRADSNSYFQKTDELIITGATGTNVMDLVFAIKY